jgi:pyruvate carboxylase
MDALGSYGDLSILPTRYFLEPLEIGEELSVEIETGKTLYIKLLAVGPTELITGRREVYFELNGEARVLTVVDKRSRKFWPNGSLVFVHCRFVLSLAVEKTQRLKANPSNPGEVGAPMSGIVVEIRLKGESTDSA